MKKPPVTEKRTHHYLVCGSIIHTNDEEQICSIDINGIVANDTKNIPAYQLARAQQVLQANFFRRMEDVKVEVRDVVIQNMIYLGFMTDAEFKRQPEGMTIQELAKKLDEPIDPVAAKL